MDTATVSYSLMMFAVGSLIFASVGIILSSLYEVYRRWSLQVGYRSGYHPEQGFVRLFGVALIRRYMTGASGATIALTITCSALLLLFFAPGFNALRKMTPQEFHKDFQKFQQERK